MGFTIPNLSDVPYDVQANPDAGDYAILAAAHAGTGVLSGCAVTAQSPPDMTVAVAAGGVAVLGQAATVAGGDVAIAAAHANPRFDLIVADADGDLSVVQGTPAAVGAGLVGPVFPAFDPEAVVVLAAVYVTGGATAITDDPQMIVDKRVSITLGPDGVIVEGDSRLTDARTPTGPAGGVLSGSYPNPTFADDMATQAELDAVAAAKANASHTHAAADIASGVLARARLPQIAGLLHKLDATAPPTAGDDTADGYGVGSLWVDVSADAAWVCVDASPGAAVWRLASPMQDVQVFTSSGTWTKPAWAAADPTATTRILLLGGGSGGGSGARRATGVACSGGGGGQGGAFVEVEVLTSDLRASGPITVGAGGAGGASVTTDDTNGSPGGVGGSTVADILSPSGGVRARNSGQTAAAGGSTGTANGSSGITAMWTPSTGGNCSAGAAGGSAGFHQHLAGGPGGAGGGIDAANDPKNGGNGGYNALREYVAPGGSAPGGAGTSPSVSSPFPGFASGYGSGDGGGGGAASASGAGGAGGNGALYGAGGGGGGASRNGSASGKGGDGASGIAIVITTAGG